MLGTYTTSTQLCSRLCCHAMHIFWQEHFIFTEKYKRLTHENSTNKPMGLHMFVSRSGANAIRSHCRFRRWYCLYTYWVNLIKIRICLKYKQITHKRKLRLKPISIHYLLFLWPIEINSFERNPCVYARLKSAAGTLEAVYTSANLCECVSVCVWESILCH